MSGKPAARQGDMTRKGLDIVQGSAGVLIGAPTGVACSVCPKKKDSPNYGNPVNPVLGSKVLPGETDIALPGPLPFILSRAYSSYRTRTPAPVGVFGPGWKAPFDIRLQIRDEGLILNDSGGRSIHFEPLFPGEISYSRSESLWLARGGVAAQHSSQPLSALWQVLPEDVRLSPHVYLATNSLQGPWWILSWPERVPGADEVLPPEPPAYRVLTGVVDGFGRTLAFHRAAEGDVAGAVTAVTGPDGRTVRYGYNSQRQVTSVTYPDGLRSSREYDEKGRLTAETSRSGETTRYSYDDPASELPTGIQDATGSTKQMAWSRYGQLLAFTDCSGYTTRYEYDRYGQQIAVHREEGISTYSSYNPRGQLVSQKDAQGREIRYEYSAAGDLTATVSPDGKRSTIEYDKRGRPVSVTEGGLTRSMGYDAAGRITVLTNENGSQSTFRYDPVDRLTEQRGFDGRTQRYHYDLTGKLTQSEDEGLITLWHYDASDRITHRTVNGDPAEQWQYDEHGWLTTLSHTCEGHRVSVHYGYDDKGRLTGERQTVENPETGEMLWEHETGHAYSEQGLATRQEPDGLPPVEWLTYGSGYLAGMKLGGTPLVEYTRDRLHRETARSFGGAGSTAGYEQATAYTLTGQLQSRHLNLPQLDCDYTWNDNGQLVRISGPQECREYRYSGTGRLTGVHTTAANLDIDIPYATDPAGNRLPDPELHPDSTLTAWPDNRIAEDAHYVYRYDEYGRLAEKTDRIPEGVIRMHDERTHHYHYDSQHRLVFYTRIQHGEPQVESRYLYDPLGRRTGKRVWRRERDLTGWMSLSRKPEETWYGWDGDRLTTVQTQQTRIQTVYQPGSFTPLLRIETENGEQAKARHRSLAEVLQEDTGVTLPAELAVMLGRLERELRQGSVSEESQQWLAQCGLTAEQMAAQLEAEYIPERKLHLYHCDHRGLPLALISPEGETAWQGEYDEWGNLLGEESAQHLQQSLRLPGQQYDEESGLYYNRNRYYDPLQGRYITQDPIGLRGEWNLYKYPLNPVRFIDSLGLKFHVNG
ncbi:RHS repeat-associated core domain-containing protein, partial [Escherichia coli O130]|nr:RHS repeat protein [Escherichia coli O130]